MGKKTMTREQQIKNAVSQMRAAAIFAFISAVITATVSLININTAGVAGLEIFNEFAFIDVAVMVVLGILLLKLKSRVVAIILLGFYLLERIIMLVEYGIAPNATTIFFIIMLILGVTGAFQYQKIRREPIGEEAMAVRQDAYDQPYYGQQNYYGQPSYGQQQNPYGQPYNGQHQTPYGGQPYPNQQQNPYGQPYYGQQSPDTDIHDLQQPGMLGQQQPDATVQQPEAPEKNL